VDSSSSSSGRDMPDLFSVGSDSSDSGSSELDWDWSSGAEGDDEESADSSDNSDDMNRRPRLRRWVREEVETMYKQHYEEPRDNLPRGPSHLYHTLTALKATCADHFRQQLCVSPVTSLRKVQGLRWSTPKALRSSAFGYSSGVPRGTSMQV
jgi:hypothetical protein